jgi:hypothetical protein
MKAQNNIIALLMVALLISIFVAAHPTSTEQNVLPIIRAQQIELVDANGKIRVSLKIEEGGETVFRMMDSDQTIRVKIGASKEGSAFVLLNNETNPGIHALAKKEKTSFTITDQAGKKKEMIP